MKRFPGFASSFIIPARELPKPLCPLLKAMTQLGHIETTGKRPWSSADNLRANSNYATNE
jgi:hypothetical protein